MKTIDAHAHLAYNVDWSAVDRLVESRRYERIHLLDLDGFMGVFAKHETVMEANRRYPGYFCCFSYLDLDGGSPDDINAVLEQGFVGLKPYKPRRDWCDEAYYPFFDRAQSLGMPMVFHTGIVMPGEAAGADGKPPRTGSGIEHLRPGFLGTIAEAFPRLQIQGAHLGYPDMEDTALNLYWHANIVHDFSGYRNTLTWLQSHLDNRTHDGTARYFNDKLLFGTDQVYGTNEANAMAFKLTDYWQLFFELVGETYYRWGQPEEREKIFHANAAKLKFPTR